MSRTLVIDPVTRIEGHARITLVLSDEGQVEDAKFHVTQFRGFEKFCEGRPFPEMPSLTARTCGICPVSHLLASSKACDDLMAVEIPETAGMLRRMVNYAQLVQSHALSWFHLSSPDFLLGWETDPSQRNVFGLLSARPEIARDGVALRRIGQTIIELLAGKRVHPAWIVPGGVGAALTATVRDQIRALLPEAISIAERTLEAFVRDSGRFTEEIASFGNFPTLYMGMVDDQGCLEHYDGWLRIKDHRGEIVADHLDPRSYAAWIDEAVEPYSYMKFPYLRAQGYPAGMYRVGPLARLNVADRCGTPRADAALAAFRALGSGGIVQSSFFYHQARLIEVLFALERIAALCDDPRILDPHVRARARTNRFEGIGVSEAPRGTLIHHYRVDAQGMVTWVNLVIATGHNNLAMNQGVLQVARRWVDGARLQEPMLDRVEALIRCYDPCLSCATHAVGTMPLAIELRSRDGALLDQIARGIS